MARPGLTKHRKFLRLSAALGSAILARGHLETLWDTCYENGDDFLGGADDVELLAQWAGSPGVLTSSLLTCGCDGPGFIEEIPDRPGRYRIHDLFDHAPDYVRKRWHRECQRKDSGRRMEDHVRSASGQRPVTDQSLTHTPAPAPAPAPALKNILVESGDSTPQRSGPGPSKNGKPDPVQVEQLLAHYRERLGRQSYRIQGIPNRERIIAEAFKHATLDELKIAVDIFATHKAFAWNRGENPDGKKYNGLCEYILAKGKKCDVPARLEEIAQQGGYDIVEE
jgi:hypothetical protein